MEEVDNILVKFVILMIQDDNEVDILFLEVRKMQCQCNRLPELFIRVWLFSGFFESQKDIRMIITLLSPFEISGQARYLIDFFPYLIIDITQTSNKHALVCYADGIVRFSAL